MSWKFNIFTGTFDYYESGGGLTVGSDNQIPYANSAGDDFDYSANFLYDGTSLTIAGATPIVLSAIGADTDNSVVVVNSSNELKTDEIDSRVWGSSLVDYTGTPADNQLAIFTDANTVEGSSDLTFDGSDFIMKQQALLGGATKVSAKSEDWASKITKHYKCNDDAANTAFTEEGGNTQLVYTGANSEDLSVTGKIGKGVQFGSTVSNKYIYVSGGWTAGCSTDYSVSFWFKLDSDFSAGNSSTSADQYIFYGYRISVLLNNSNGKLYFKTYDGTGRDMYTDKTSWTGGTWYHVVGSWDGTTFKIYINSVEQSTTFAFGATQTSTGKMVIGCWANIVLFYDGAIDDLRFFGNGHLTQAEINGIYNSGSGTEDNTSTGAELDIQAIGSSDLTANHLIVSDLDDLIVGDELEVQGKAYIDGDVLLGGELQLDGISAGTDNTVLCLNSSNQIITDEINSQAWNTSETWLQASGTPVDSQLAIWTDSSTIEGDSDLTFDGSNFVMKQRLLFGGTGGTLGLPTWDVSGNQIAHWKMNDNAASTTIVDAEGSYNATCSVNTSTITATGIVSNSLYFNGGSYASETSLGTGLGDSVDNVSISCWINADVTNSDDGIVYIGTPGSHAEFGLSLSSNEIRGYTNSGKKVTGAFTSTGSWHHIVLTYDNPDLKLYIDGSEVDTATDATSLDFDGLTTYIGAYYNTGYKFDGKIDDVRIFDETLTSAEVTGLYVSGDGTEADTGYSSISIHGIGTSTITANHLQSDALGSLIIQNDLEVQDDLYVDGNAKILSDTKKLFLGAGGDATLEYDGTDAKIITDVVAASDLIVDCGTEKTLELTEEVWDDQQVNMGDIAGSGWFGSAWCDVVEYRSGVALEFENSTSSGYKIKFNSQLTHRYKEGEDIEFHIHIGSDANSGDAVFKLTYQWASLEGTFGSSTSTQETITIDGTDGKHQIEEIVATISGSGKGISSILLCELERLADDDDDTFAHSVYVIGLDFHIPVNTMGSRQEGTK